MGVESESASVRVEAMTASYRRRFRRREVLHGVDLAVAPGRIAAVVGPNGAGKTTLLRILAAFKQPDRGVCTIAGLSPEAYRRRFGCGYLPESLVFPRVWTCRDILGRSADLSAAPAERETAFARSVARSGLDPDTLDKPARLCSKGTRRRLGLAHALAGEPAFVVLDEPFSGLDARARAALRDEVRAARDRGAAVLFASHETAEVHRLADQVHILEDGRARPWSAQSEDPATDLEALEAELLRGAS